MEAREVRYYQMILNVMLSRFLLQVIRMPAQVREDSSLLVCQCAGQLDLTYPPLRIVSSPLAPLPCEACTKSQTKQKDSEERSAGFSCTKINLPNNKCIDQDRAKNS